MTEKLELISCLSDNNLDEFLKNENLSRYEKEGKLLNLLLKYCDTDNIFTYNNLKDIVLYPKNLSKSFSLLTDQRYTYLETSLLLFKYQIFWSNSYFKKVKKLNIDKDIKEFIDNYNNDKQDTLYEIIKRKKDIESVIDYSKNNISNFSDIDQFIILSYNFEENIKSFILKNKIELHQGNVDTFLLYKYEENLYPESIDLFEKDNDNLIFDFILYHQEEVKIAYTYMHNFSLRNMIRLIVQMKERRIKTDQLVKNIYFWREKSKEFKDTEICIIKGSRGLGILIKTKRGFRRVNTIFAQSDSLLKNTKISKDPIKLKKNLDFMKVVKDITGGEIITIDDIFKTNILLILSGSKAVFPLLKEYDLDYYKILTGVENILYNKEKYTSLN